MTANAMNYPLPAYAAAYAAIAPSFDDYQANYVVMQPGNSTVLNQNASIVDNLNNSEQAIETERQNRLHIEMKEVIDSFSTNDLVKNHIQSRVLDGSLNKILGTISSLQPVNQSVELTSDMSAHFTINLAAKTIFLEFYFEKSEGEPDFVYLLYENDKCINTGKGDVNVISNKLIRLIKR